MTAPRPPVRVGLRTIPARAGLDWIRRGLRLFLRRPVGFMGLFGLVLLAMMVTFSSIELEALALILMPLLSLGFMIASEDVLNDLPIRPSVFARPMLVGRDERLSLLAIGLVYFAAFMLMYLFGDSIDGGEAKAWMLAVMTPGADGTIPAPPEISGVGTFVLLLKTFGLAIVSVPLWHAPALVYWGRQRAAQAMFSSIVALWRTRAAFAVYTLGWCAVGVLFALLMLLVAAATGNLGVAVVLMTPVSWAMSAVFYVTLWFGFVDTFQITSTQPIRTVLAPTDNPRS